MRRLIAYSFRLLFRLSFFRKRYYGIYTRLFQPRQLFRNVRVTTTHRDVKLQLHLDDWIQQNIFFLGEYESAEIHAALQLLPKSGLFFDVGGNIGLYSLIMAKNRSPDAGIVAFEPFSTNYEAFREHIRMNGFSNIQLEKMAVSDKEGSLQLYYDPSEQNRGMVSALPDQHGTTETVPSVSIDSYLDSRPHLSPDLIKIDVEGLEYRVLLGMTETLKKHRPALLIEIFDSGKNNHYHDIHNILYGAGYQKFYITDSGALSKEPTNSARLNYVFLPEERVKQ